MNGMLRTLLILGRISNLPTVWSNVLAAWLVSGADINRQFFVVCVGASLLYVGGMFWNDAIDATFDQAHRPERPIPSGCISRRAVVAIGAILLAAGSMVFVVAGGAGPIWVALLSGCIVVYDVVHKKTEAAPWIMAGCRALLVLAAASAVQQPASFALLLYASGLFLYVAGLSLLARKESACNIASRWPVVLFLAAVFLLLVAAPSHTVWSWLRLAAFVGWLLFCLHQVYGPSRNIGRAVAGLLAGIILLDWFAVGGSTPIQTVDFAVLFGLTLVLQRRVPAT